MSNKWLSLYAIFVLALFAKTCFAKTDGMTPAENRAKALELLDKYAQTQDKIQSSFIIKSRNTMEGATNHPISSSRGRTQYKISEEDYCYDGNRYSVRLKRWLNLNKLPEKSLSEDHASYNYSRELWDGNTTFSYARDNRNHQNQLGRLIIDDKRKPTSMELLPREELFGRFAGDEKRIDEVLRQADKISLRDKMEKVGKSECYVINAVIKGGKYAVWIDPQHGYNVAKAEIHKGEGSQAYERQFESGFSLDGLHEVFSFKKADDVWFPREIYSKGISKWPGGHFSRGSSNMEIISLNLNPDHNALGSFLPDDIRNGAKVGVVGVDNILYTWRDGKVVDKDGKVIMDCSKKATAQKAK